MPVTLCMSGGTNKCVIVAFAHKSKGSIIFSQLDTYSETYYIGICCISQATVIHDSARMSA